ncbi:tubulin-tyrosine ligase family protein, putative [Ichthyophthirius multifiliis]|uniref:Tubulin-tyrosine ligase family protein, putative n=1 Tax=Ichthyophthirius multifiliis TaxID=5932 RepID=G0R6M9_ICHMU|nr:tubulin-tyrosine ligase family protein, putative [Ichthyophthirius multifiliis]EGR26880.1 tubulin-tyrosine ligase family protein, putative [Ichthyophthirius multifiliis]|eukprot:XP_004023764.1 tubulin-tyrosine ligase family protein, putative [Ichthyophthirius multifiliis]
MYVYDITPLTYCINSDSPTFYNDMEEFLSYFLSKSCKYIYIYLFNLITFIRNVIYRIIKTSTVKLQLKIIYISSKVHRKQQKIGFCQPRYHQSLYQGQNIWILKPTDFNRGSGILLFNTAKDLLDIFKKYGDKYMQKKFVIQKYIEQPLLIKERKFDIRIWVMVVDNKQNEKKNNNQNNLQIYIFKEGYIRTSSEKYQTQQLNDLIIHLTNNAVQKTDQRYSRFEQGNQLSYDQLEQVAGINFRKEILGKIKEIICFSIDAVKNKISGINNNFKGNQFEIFGYDFIIDQQLNPWLIEVNTNPCIEESSLLLKQLIPRMIDDAFKISIDSFFCGEKIEEGKQYFKLKNYNDDENLWFFFLYFNFFLKKNQFFIKRELQQNVNYTILKKKRLLKVQKV